MPGRISWAGKLPVTLPRTSKEPRVKRPLGLVTEPQTRRIHGGYKCKNQEIKYNNLYNFL